LNSHRWLHSLRLFAAALLLAGLSTPCVALAQPEGSQVYEMLYLTNLTRDYDLSDVANTLRNMLPNAKTVNVNSKAAIAFKGTPEDLATAKKIVADLDKPKKIYRLTYTVRELDGSKVIGAQHYSAIVASGSTTILKQGSRIPVLTSDDKGGTSVTYLDIGQDIEASLDSSLDEARLRTKVIRSSVADEKSTVATQDPVIRQTTLEGTSILVQNKPLVIGTLDIPDSTRHQEIEVVAEAVR
jgi:hypothetical protein